jgi:hypothetical protein
VLAKKSDGNRTTSDRNRTKKSGKNRTKIGQESGKNKRENRKKIEKKSDEKGKKKSKENRMEIRKKSFCIFRPKRVRIPSESCPNLGRIVCKSDDNRIQVGRKSYASQICLHASRTIIGHKSDGNRMKNRTGIVVLGVRSDRDRSPIGPGFTSDRMRTKIGRQ